MTIAGAGLERTIHRFEVLAAIARLNFHGPLKAAHRDGTVASAQIDMSFVRHVDLNLNAMALSMDADHAGLVWKANFNRDSVASLAFHHLDAARTELPAFRCHPSFNGG